MRCTTQTICVWVVVICCLIYTQWPATNGTVQQPLESSDAQDGLARVELRNAEDVEQHEDCTRPNCGRNILQWQRHSFATHGTHRDVDDSIELLQRERGHRIVPTKEEKANTHVLLVTNAINDPTIKTGVATIILRQAESYTRRGYTVTLLSVMPSEKEYKALVVRQMTQLLKIGITLEPLYEASYPMKSYGSKAMTRSYSVYHWILQRQHTFQAIVFHDFAALGFYTLWAKMTNFAFQTVPITLLCIASNRMENQYEARAPGSRDVLVEYYMERKTVEMADFLLAPAQTYFSWMRENGYSFDHRRTLTLQQPLKHGISNTQASIGATLKPNSIAYIGAITRHGGATMFLEAISYLHSKRKRLPAKVLFVGSAEPERAETIRITLEALDIKFEIKSMTSAQAIVELQEGNYLLVRPTYQEHVSVLTVDAVASGVPTIMTRGSGISELYRKAITFEPTVSSLAATIHSVLKNGFEVPEMRRTPQQAGDDLISFFETMVLPLRKKLLNKDIPEIEFLDDQVTIAIPTNHRPEELQELLESLLRQDYLGFRVMVVDDTPDPEMEVVYTWAEGQLARAGIRFDVLRPEVSGTERMYAAEKRNLLISATRTQWLMLMDDDDIALPNMVSLLLAEAYRSGADLVSGFCNNFKTYQDYGLKKDLYVALAAGYAQGGSFFVHNTGKATMLIKRDVAERAGGCTMDNTGEQSPYVDWDLYTNIGLAGYKISFVPTAVYRYRERSKNSIYYSIDAEGRWLGHRKMVMSWCRKLQLTLEECDVLEFSRGKLAKPFVLTFGEYE